MKLIYFLKGGEQISFREKEVLKDSDASKEKHIHHYWLFCHTPSLCPPPSPLTY